MTFPLPAPENRFLESHLHLLHDSFLHYVGRHLADMPWEGASTAQVFWEAPFVLLSHNTAADPVFTYGNRKALELFEMDWATLTALPSRHSAEPLAREERERLLKAVSQQGYIDNYAGVRISSTGKRFLIRHALVWNLRDGAGQYAGQAACFADWQYL
jgi:hypothetical protein